MYRPYHKPNYEIMYIHSVSTSDNQAASDSAAYVQLMWKGAFYSL